MYAELLEMNVDEAWGDLDGLPDDLETGWVAVAPVPVGKRCLAVAHQGSASGAFRSSSIFPEISTSDSTEYNLEVARVGQTIDAEISIDPPSKYDTGLHFGCGLALEWNPPCAGCHQMEGAGCCRLRDRFPVSLVYHSQCSVLIYAIDSGGEIHVWQN